MLQGAGRVAAGRFGGRDAKMARIREQEARMAAEAAAKLGVPSAATASAAAGTSGCKGSDVSDTTSEARVPSSKKRGAGSAAAEEASQGAAASSGKSGRSGKKDGKRSKRRKEGAAEGEAGEEGAAGAGGAAGAAGQPEQQQEAGAAPAKKQRIVIEPVVPQSGPVYAFVPTPATGEPLCSVAGVPLPCVWVAVPPCRPPLLRVACPAAVRRPPAPPRPRLPRPRLGKQASCPRCPAAALPTICRVVGREALLLRRLPGGPR